MGGECDSTHSRWPTTAKLDETINLLAPPYYWFWAAMALGLGLLIGSFLNVAIYRLPLGLSVNDPRRSICFRCGTRIKWYDNIPVLSFLLLGGHDRACGAGFSARYMMVEIMTGLAFLGLFVVFNPPGSESFAWATIWYAVFVCLLIVGSFTDLDHWIVPGEVTVYGAIAAVAAALVLGFVDPASIIGVSGPFPAIRLESGPTIEKVIAVMAGPGYRSWTAQDVLWWEPLANAIIGGLFGPLLLQSVAILGKLLFRREAMGFGDVELFILIGATLGAVNTLLVLVLASFLGSIGGITMMLLSRFDTGKNSPLELGEAFAGAEDESTRSSGSSPDPTEAEQARALAESLEMQWVDLATVVPTEAARASFPATLVAECGVLPLEWSEKGVKLAVADPLNTKLIERLRRELQREMEFVIAAPGQLAEYAGNWSTQQPVAASTAWRSVHTELAKEPLPRPVHLLPFIPWITLAALIILFLQPGLRAWLREFFYPAAYYGL
jgi:leader peptidase (prepilin peptidase)/N-methyltransferase